MNGDRHDDPDGRFEYISIGGEPGDLKLSAYRDAAEFDSADWTIHGFTALYIDGVRVLLRRPEGGHHLSLAASRMTVSVENPGPTDGGGPIVRVRREHSSGEQEIPPGPSA